MRRSTCRAPTRRGAIVVSVFQLDADGMVMVPLDPRVCTVPLAQIDPQLPVIAGVNYFQLLSWAGASNCRRCRRRCS